MALNDEGTAPYAPAYAITKPLDAFRDTGVQINQSSLVRLGVSDSIVPRTLQSFRILGLLNEDGSASEDLLAFKRASHDTYQNVFAEILRRAYSPVFQILGPDPSTKTAQQLEDAFRNYTPSSLRPRMVNLFLGLCHYAGIFEELPTKKSGPRTGGGGTHRGPKSAPKVRETPPKPPGPGTEHPPQHGPGSTTKAELGSGGTVTLTVNVDVVKLSTEDRAFVFDLIDRVNAYGRKPQAALQAGNGTTASA